MSRQGMRSGKREQGGEGFPRKGVIITKRPGAKSEEQRRRPRMLKSDLMWSQMG